MALCIVFLMYVLSSSGNYSHRSAILKLSFSCPGITVNTGSMSVFPPPSHAGNPSDTKSFGISFVQIFPSVDKVLRGGRSSNAESRGH